MTEHEHADWFRIHDRWTDGWRSGRTGYVWLLPLTDSAVLNRLVNDYQYALRDLPGFDLVPLECLHIQVQQVGFTDEITAEQASDVVAAARERVASIEPVRVTFENARVRPESIVLPAAPASGDPAGLQAALRAGTADVLGSGATTGSGNDTPAGESGAVTVAHSTAEGTAAFARATVGGVVAEPAAVDVHQAELVELTRDHANVEWRTVSTIDLS